jgi:3-deoxy-D-manno-octulosonate 8-phosphate phosphatase (KDO 8-P phosphatase)
LGVEIAFISGRFSKATEQRAGELGVRRVINGSSDKLADLTAMAKELGIDASEVAFIGDDLQDLPCIEWAGLGIAVADSSPAVLSASDWVCPRRGGDGAVRDAMEHIAMLNGTRI